MTEKQVKEKGLKSGTAMFVRLFKIRGPGYHWTHDHFVRFDEAHPDRDSWLPEQYRR